MKPIFGKICAAALGTLVALPALATPTFYTDKASFITAAGALVADDFTMPDNVFDNGAIAAPYSIGYPHFSLSSPLLLRTYGTFAADQYSAGFFGTAQLVLAHPTTAFGFEVKSAGTAHVLTTLTFSAAGGSIDTVLSGFEAFDNIQFFGVIDAAGFGSVNLLDNDFGDYIEADNALIGRSPTAVPEPAAWALMIAGFAMVGAAQRRRSRALPA